MNKILISNVTLDGKVVDILIEGGKISAIGSEIDAFSANEIIDGKNKTAIPGFINMHTHTAMSLMRGVEEDVPLHQWLKRIWEIETRLDDEIIFWGTKLAVLEMIKSGTTSFFDMYWRIVMAQKAANQMGIRSNHTYVFLDNFDREKASRSKDECVEQYEISRNWDPLSRFDVSVHSDYTVMPETIVWASDFVRKHGLKLHIHLSETKKEVCDDIQKYGMSPVKHFESLGVLGPEVIAAHCVWLDEEDIDILGKYKVNVVHNINSNLKLSSGYRFKYEELKRAGANICLGTDGAASSNNLDMLEAIKTMALLQKAWREKPEAMPLGEIMDIATINGAKALGINTGEIKTGYLADILLIDTDSPVFIPDINFTGNLIYAANSSCIDTVICNGKILMRNRKVEGEREIIENSIRMANKLLKIK